MVGFSKEGGQSAANLQALPLLLLDFLRPHPMIFRPNSYSTGNLLWETSGFRRHQLARKSGTSQLLR